MIQNLLVGLLSFTLIFNQSKFNEYINVKKYFNRANEIVVVVDNNHITCDKCMEEIIITSINEICTHSHEMPAFAVSIHEQTMDLMRKGLWLIFKYDDTQYHNGMPFDELLIEVNSEYYGFNIIRKYDDRYDGRCFYLNLNNDMSGLHNCIIDLLKQTH